MAATESYFRPGLHPVAPFPADKPFAQIYVERLESFGETGWVANAETGYQTSFGNLARRIYSLSSSLVQRGYVKGDTLLVLSRNCVDYITILLAGGLSHLTLSPANPAYTAPELLYQLQASHAQSAFVAPDLLPLLYEAIALGQGSVQLREIIVIGNGAGIQPQGDIKVLPLDSLVEDRSYLSPVSSLDPVDDVWLLPFSSGTTGLPKGVELTHYNMTANVLQFMQHEEISNLNRGCTILGVLPMYHIYGLFMFGLAAPLIGANVVLLPAFEPVSFLKSIEKYRPTNFYAVPPLILFLAKDPRVKQYDLSSIKEILSAAAPLSAEVVEESLDKLHSLPDTRLIMRQAWGMTELSPLGTLVGVGNAGSAMGSVGRVIPETEAKIVDLDSGRTVPHGEQGELCIRGPQVMKGYFNNQEATKNTIEKDGWLMTGDIAYGTAEGDIFITDRIKELIKVKGHQVAPAELEGILLTHPGVQDACVVPIPHDRLGECPLAAVVPKPGVTLTEKQVMDHVADKVAAYKHVKEVKFVQSIPKTASGKILRRILKARFL